MPRHNVYQQRLLQACRVGDLTAAQDAVYHHGASVYDAHDGDRQGLTALHVACQYHQVRIAQWILQRCDFYVHSRDSIFQSTPLMLAAEAGHADMVQLLLRHARPNVNHADAHGWTALHLACMHRHEAVVDLLLRHPDMDVNCVDHVTGDTALLKVCFRDDVHYPLAARLLHQGRANVHHRNDTGWTALERAAYHGQLKLVQLLADAGANLQDALWRACQKRLTRHVKMLTCLLNMGANPTQPRSCDGWTPLHYLCHTSPAARQRPRRRQIIALLLQYTTNVNVCNHDGLTPLDIAEACGNVPAIEMLHRMGATSTSSQCSTLPRHLRKPNNHHAPTHVPPDDDSSLAYSDMSWASDWSSSASTSSLLSSSASSTQTPVAVEPLTTFSFVPVRHGVDDDLTKHRDFDHDKGNDTDEHCEWTLFTSQVMQWARKSSRGSNRALVSPLQAPFVEAAEI